MKKERVSLNQYNLQYNSTFRWVGGISWNKQRIVYSIKTKIKTFNDVFKIRLFSITTGETMFISQVKLLTRNHD